MAATAAAAAARDRGTEKDTKSGGATAHGGRHDMDRSRDRSRDTSRDRSRGVSGDRSRERGGDAAGGFGNIGEYYRGVKEQQKRARVEVGKVHSHTPQSYNSYKPPPLDTVASLSPPMPDRINHCVCTTAKSFSSRARRHE